MSKEFTRREFYLNARYELAKRRATEDCNEDSTLSLAQRLTYHLSKVPMEVPEDFPLVGVA